VRDMPQSVQKCRCGAAGGMEVVVAMSAWLTLRVSLFGASLT